MTSRWKYKRSMKLAPDMIAPMSGERMRQLRVEKVVLSQAALATLLDMSQTMVSRAERGDTVPAHLGFAMRWLAHVSQQDPLNTKARKR